MKTTIKDIKRVANELHLAEPTLEQIDFVLERYEEKAKQDPTGFPDSWIEQILVDDLGVSPKTTVKILDVGWSSDEYSETPTKVELRINPKQIQELKKHQQYAKENNVYIKYPIYSYDLFDEEGEECSGIWRADVTYILVHATCLFFYAQNKWDSGDQIETEAFTID